jgi:monovalent cation/proton antiporter MnhG/PhaG subunit
MSAQGIAIAVLLVLGVAVTLVSCVGVAVMPTVHARLHYLAPASVVGSALIAAAVVTQEAYSPQGIKAMLVVVVLWASNPVLTHATGRGARLRRQGSARGTRHSRRAAR